MKFLDSWIEACFAAPVFITSIVVQNDPVVWNLQNKISYRLNYKLGIFNGSYTKENVLTVYIFNIFFLYSFVSALSYYELNCIINGIKISIKYPLVFYIFIDSKSSTCIIYLNVSNFTLFILGQHGLVYTGSRS